MEGIQTIQALKAVQSSLPAQTTIPSDELVMLYATDGTPIAKISRDDLVKAVASVMASNSQNTFSKLLGVQANGIPMGIGASDLASVLGATYTQSVDDFNEVTSGVLWRYVNGATLNNPKYGENYDYGVILNLIFFGHGAQLFFVANGEILQRGVESSVWGTWQKITTESIA